MCNFTLFRKGAYLSGIKLFNHLWPKIKSLWNEIKLFKTALKRFLNTHSFYSVDEYLEHSYNYESWFLKWYDMIWYDMIWYDMIWYDMMWYMISWYGMIYDMIWYDIWYDMIWYDVIWYMMWYMISWYDMIYDMIWYDIWYDMIYDMIYDMNNKQLDWIYNCIEYNYILSTWNIFDTNYCQAATRMFIILHFLCMIVSCFVLDIFTNMTISIS